MGGGRARPLGGGHSRNWRYTWRAAVLGLAVVSALGLVALAGPVAGEEHDLLPGDPDQWVFYGDAAEDEGELVLTENSPNEEGMVFYDQPFTGEDRLVTEFTYIMDGDGEGEGLVVFLVDGTVEADELDLDVQKGRQSDLGYKESGLPDAYLGIGLDRHGVFAVDWDAGEDEDDARPNSVVLRGAAMSQEHDVYEYVTHEELNRSLAGEPVDVAIELHPNDAGGSVTVELTWADETRVVLDQYPYTEPLPAELKVGFVAATSPHARSEHRILALDTMSRPVVDDVTLTANRTTLEPEQTTSLAATVLDQFGDPIANETVTLSLDGSGSVEPIVTETNASGVATATYTAPANGTEATITVAANGETDAVTLTVLQPPHVVTTVGDHAPEAPIGTPYGLPVTLTNQGEIATNGSVSLVAGGAVVDVVTAPLGPGDDQNVTLAWTPTVSDLGVDTLTVIGPDANVTVPITVTPSGGPNTVALSIDNDGGVHTVGVPFATNGTLADAFPDGLNGVSSVFTYDATTGWTREHDFDQSLTGLEALAVVTRGAGPPNIAVELEAVPENTTSRTLSPGWNLVPANAYGDAESLAADTGAQLLLHRYGAPTTPGLPGGDEFGHYVAGSAAWGVTPPTLCPFAGYFVYVSAPATLEPSVTNPSTSILEQLGYG